MAINFPSAPAVNDTLTSGGSTWRWDGTSWVSANVEFSSGTKMLFQQTAAPTGWTKDTTHDNKALRVVTGTAASGGTTNFTTAFASRTVAGTTAGTTATGTLDSVTVTGSIGNTTATGTVGDTTLNATQIPSHTHFMAANVALSNAIGTLSNTQQVATNLDTGDRWAYDLHGTATAATIGLTSATGSSGAHSHGFTGTAHNHTFTANAHGHTFTGAGHTHTYTSTLDMAVQYVDLIIATKN